MLKWAVLICGAVLAAWGIYWGWTGWSIVEVERGWGALIVGGTVFAAGAVVMALSAVIFRVDALISTLRTVQAAPREATAVSPSPSAPRPAPAPVAPVGPPQALVEDAAAPQAPAQETPDRSSALPGAAAMAGMAAATAAAAGTTIALSRTEGPAEAGAPEGRSEAAALADLESELASLAGIPRHGEAPPPPPAPEVQLPPPPPPPAERPKVISLKVVGGAEIKTERASPALAPPPPPPPTFQFPGLAGAHSAASDAAGESAAQAASIDEQQIAGPKEEPARPAAPVPPLVAAPDHADWPPPPPPTAGALGTRAEPAEDTGAAAITVTGAGVMTAASAVEASSAVESTPPEATLAEEAQLSVAAVEVAVEPAASIRQEPEPVPEPPAPKPLHELSAVAPPQAAQPPTAGDSWVDKLFEEFDKIDGRPAGAAAQEIPAGPPPLPPLTMEHLQPQEPPEIAEEPPVSSLSGEQPAAAEPIEPPAPELDVEAAPTVETEQAEELHAEELHAEEPALPVEEPSADSSQAAAPMPEPEAAAVLEPPPPPPLPPVERKLARSYESAGVVYKLYEDGSIDAEAQGGTFHFASLDELRQFIERRSRQT